MKMHVNENKNANDFTKLFIWRKIYVSKEQQFMHAKIGDLV